MRKVQLLNCLIKQNLMVILGIYVLIIKIDLVGVVVNIFQIKLNFKLN